VETLLVPGPFPWVDLGSWAALRGVLPADGEGNVVLGAVEARGTRRSILVAEAGRRIEVRDLADTVVVHAANGRVLVADLARCQDVKRLARMAAEEPGTQGLFLYCRDCLVEPGEARVAAIGVRGLRVACVGDRVSVEPLPAAARVDARETVLDALAGRPLALRPVVKHYAWGGAVLSSYLGRRPDVAGRPTSEAWLTSTRPEARAALAQAPLTLDELVRERPRVLGPWAAELYGTDLPIFTKFLSTRFPARVHLGFSREVAPATFLAWLDREQELLRELHRALRIADGGGFRAFRLVYESWAASASRGAWAEVSTSADGPLVRGLRRLVRPAAEPSLPAILEDLRANRARIVSCLNEVALRRQGGNLLLCPAGTVHGVFGMSLQAHPVDRARERLQELLAALREGAARGVAPEELGILVRRAGLEELRARNEGEPKDEAWLPLPVGEEIMIVETQQTSDTTRSLADFFTPFAWEKGRVVFRKGDPSGGLSSEELKRSLALVDFVARPVEAYRRAPTPLPAAMHARSARLQMILDDPRACPYFTLHRLLLDGTPGAPALWEGEVPTGSFRQLIVTRGALSLEDGAGRVLRLATGAPAFIPASCRERYTLTAREGADLLMVGVPVP
jgi:hypothetical protein